MSGARNHKSGEEPGALASCRIHYRPGNGTETFMNIRYWLRHPDRFVRRVWHYFYEIRHPDEPFLAPAAVRFLDRNLARDGAGLEWGSGRSTAWFAQRLATLVTVR